MASAESNESVTTRLLTLLNVSAVSTRKRKRVEEPAMPLPPSKKLNSKKGVSPENAKNDSKDSNLDKDMDLTPEDAILEEPEVENDPYNFHFGPHPKHLTEQTRTAVDERNWISSKRKCGKVGEAFVQLPDGLSTEEVPHGTFLLDRLRGIFEKSLTENPEDSTARKDLLQSISSYQDIYLTRQDIAARKLHREVVSVHILNHIMKIRRRVLKNNEKLSNSKDMQDFKSSTLLDQGFVRPSILIILPFRSSAKHWVSALLQQTPSHQVENKARFLSDFSIPNGAEEKLLTAPPGTYPPDHVANMSGNIDDHFRVGMKVTRKSIKMFSDFYSSDVILASPLGLRELIEKEKSADYLSSIEVLVIDQLDVLTMQNWSHLDLIFTYLNTIPKQSHDADFSRIKPWYLDGHARYLRQSILFTSYETPEIRALYNRNLRNVSGKQRIGSAWSSVQVPEGIRQTYIKFECPNARSEIDKRFEYFTTQMFPALLKSAVQSVNTVIFIPSYFDYARVRNWMKNQATVTFSVLSEDSDNRDISRAREAFFSGNKAILLVTERFHFFRRYKLRGIRNVVFYAPPDHPQFYSEFLSYPFLDDGVQAEDVTCKVLYSKYDYMRLERIIWEEHSCIFSWFLVRVLKRRYTLPGKRTRKYSATGYNNRLLDLCSLMATIVRRVAGAMERIAPLRLAEKWDNVGLLVESPVARLNANQVLLTIDLTTAVCDEALSTPTAAIVTYHPTLFKPLTSLTLANPLQRSLLRCAAAGVSIFSPHTSLDSAKHGVNDWLASAFGTEATSMPIEQKLNEELGTGIGRLVNLRTSLPFATIIPMVKSHLGLNHVQIAGPERDVSSIAICAGSGGSVFKDVKADLYWTGEMSHHEVLAAVAAGTNVILCGHSNTERGYLSRLRLLLLQELASDEGEVLEVTVSKADKDPLTIV